MNKIFFLLLFFNLIGDSININTEEMVYVPDKKTAIKIAEAIWLPLYGKSIYTSKPFIAKLEKGNIWKVEGTLPENTLGGVPVIRFRKSDCKIISVSHGK